MENNKNISDVFDKDFELYQTKKKLIEAYFIAIMLIEQYSKFNVVNFDDICCDYDNKFNGDCNNCPLWPDTGFDSNCDCENNNSFFTKYRIATIEGRFKAATIYVKEIYKQILQIKVVELPLKRINKSE